MSQNIANINPAKSEARPWRQEEWLKILGKGMVTLPKKWRDELGIMNGDIVKAKKEGNKVVIEASKNRNVPYRVYTKEEISEFLRDDVLPKKLAERVQQDLAK